MKKTFCTLLSLGLVAVLALSGCGKTDKGSEDKQSSGETTAAVEEKEDVKQESLDKNNEETTAAVEEKEETKSVSLGKLEGNVYTNAYAGFGCELDESWMIAPAEALQELPDQVMESLDGTQVGELAKGIPQIVDMMAQNITTGSTINVLYTQLSESDQKVYAALSEEEVIDSLMLSKEMLFESYAASGVEVKSMDKATMDFLGEKHTVNKTVGTAQGAEVYIVQVLNYNLSGQYGVTVTFIAHSEAEMTEMMNSFYKV